MIEEKLFYLIFLIPAALLDYKTMKVPIWLSGVVPFTTWLLYEFSFHRFYLHKMNWILFGIVFGLSIVILIVSKMGGADCIVMTMMCLYGGFLGLYGILFGFIGSMPYLLLRKNQDKAYPFVPFLATGYILSCIIFIFTDGAYL